MKSKILFTVAVGITSMMSAQNLSFTDSKFKALILSSNATNSIALNSSGNSFAVDANNDGQIQSSEALQVKVLNIEQDPNFMLINPNGSSTDPANINLTYYYSHLPDGIADALLFTNLEELHTKHSKSAVISFVNNSKIRKVQGKPIYHDFSQSNQQSIAPINFSFDNCTAIQNINDILAYSSSLNPWDAPENKLTIKNCPQITGNITISNSAIQELYLENSSISQLTFDTCKLLSKISVPNLNSLTKVSVIGGFNGATNQNIELIANNCPNLQEVVADTDHYNSVGAYFSSINVNGSSNLKKIKGLNAPTINFSNAGLINLEELDCAFYNRYTYYTTSGAYFGDVTSLNLANLPKLKTLKAFNQPITSANIKIAQALQSIDINYSAGYLTGLDVDNLPLLHTLNAGVPYHGMQTPYVLYNLKTITAQNCTSLTTLNISGNYNLETLNLFNASQLPILNLGPQLNGTPYGDSFSFLNSLNITQCVALEELGLSGTNVSSLDISTNVALKTFFLINNPQLNNINTINNVNLKVTYFDGNPLITHINLSNANQLEEVTSRGMQNLTSLNIRNSSIENWVYFWPTVNADLLVCVDDAQLSDLQTTFPTINFTTNCSAGTLATQEVKNLKNDIKIYPIPAKEFIQIESPEKIEFVKIYDTNGKLLQSEKFNENKITVNISDLVSGIYMLKITTKKGETAKKVVKK